MRTWNSTGGSPRRRCRVGNDRGGSADDGRDMMKRILVLAGLGMFLSWGLAWGEEQGRLQWDSLPREERKVLKPYEEKWGQLPAARQERLRDGARRWLALPPEERRLAGERSQRWRKLPPEQKEELRKRYREFSKLPQDERQRVREKFRWFRDLPPERQRELRDEWRNKSPEERRMFRNQQRPGRPPR